LERVDLSNNISISKGFYQILMNHLFAYGESEVLKELILANCNLDDEILTHIKEGIFEGLDKRKLRGSKDSIKLRRFDLS
jgi:hypothetical protein